MTNTSTKNRKADLALNRGGVQHRRVALPECRHHQPRRVQRPADTTAWTAPLFSFQCPFHDGRSAQRTVRGGLLVRLLHPRVPGMLQPGRRVRCQGPTRRGENSLQHPKPRLAIPYCFLSDLVDVLYLFAKIGVDVAEKEPIKV